MKMKKFKHIKIMAGALLACISTAGSAFVTVGTTASCDYDNLLDAYNDVDPNVRVTTEVEFNLETISKTQFFKGGYINCTYAMADVQTSGLSQWTRSGFGTVIDISGSNIIVTMDQFEIYGGLTLADSAAGGISVSGNVGFILSDSIVRDNTGHQGGGIRLSGSDARVTISSTRVYDNSATTDGGGIFCDDGARFAMIGDSNLKNNTAVDFGGGIFADTNCQASSLSGAVDGLEFLEYGIIGNQANKGGGVYLSGGADMTLTGNTSHPANIVANKSIVNSLLLAAGGGGVYVTGDGSSFTGTNARIDYNLAKNTGAGFAVLDSASFTMKRDNAPCWDNDECSSVSFNDTTENAGNSAAGFISNHASVIIAQTHINRNRANNAAVFTIENVSTLHLEGSLIINNGPFNQVGASELFTIRGPSSFISALDFFYNTIGTNNTYSHFLLDGTDAQQFVKIYNSLIRNQGDIITTVGAVDPVLQVGCNYVHETASFSVAQIMIDTIALNPGFVDAANNDYHVVFGSFSKDLCDESTIQSNHKGLNGNTRGYDDPSMGNLRGPFDAGAYEQVDGDIIFKNGFE